MRQEELIIAIQEIVDLKIKSLPQGVTVFSAEQLMRDVAAFLMENPSFREEMTDKIFGPIVKALGKETDLVSIRLSALESRMAALEVRLDSKREK